MSQSPTILIANRFWVLTGLGLLGAILFVPSIIAESSTQPSSVWLLLYVLVLTAVCTSATWVGLRCADAAHLPMPYLRRLDHMVEPPAKHGFVVAGFFGVLFALATIALLKSLQLPNMAGALWSRLASTFFAATAFVLFHASGLAGQGATLIALSVVMNGVFGIGLGVIYARYGFEYVLLCDATGYMLAVGFA